MNRPTFLAAALVVAGLFICFGGPLDYALRYIHFRTLTKERLIKGAVHYVGNYASDRGQYVCLYVVNCDANAASLDRVDDISKLDVETLKRTIWKRRFDTSYCPGRTTNIGIQLVPQNGHKAESNANALARWSFFNDRFIPQLGRFQSGTFTDGYFEPCTPDASLNSQIKAFSTK